ncbi:unnamed protein product, partial [marine sediment metagenome]
MGCVLRRTWKDKHGRPRKTRNYYIRYKDVRGKWCTEPTEEATKYGAERVLAEREKAVREQQGGGTTLQLGGNGKDAYLEE